MDDEHRRELLNELDELRGRIREATFAPAHLVDRALEILIELATEPRTTTPTE